MSFEKNPNVIVAPLLPVAVPAMSLAPMLMFNCAPLVAVALPPPPQVHTAAGGYLMVVMSGGKLVMSSVVLVPAMSPVVGAIAMSSFDPVDGSWPIFQQVLSLAQW